MRLSQSRSDSKVLHSVKMTHHFFFKSLHLLWLGNHDNFF
jgi:hypothetical protein